MEEQLSGVTWHKATRCGGYTGDGEACVLVAVVETGRR
jgi:hypothetical protein